MQFLAPPDLSSHFVQDTGRIIDDGHSHIPIRATGRELVKAFVGQTSRAPTSMA
jgi:hypothetical protein